MYALTYTVRLLEPLLATQPFSGEANSAVTYPYIPGSMVRGACIRTFLKATPTPPDRALFFSDDVCFLPAYPTHPANRDQRLLPRPCSWFVEKDEADNPWATVYDLALTDDAPLERPKSPGALFCAITGEDVFLYSPQIQMQIHNASENRNRKQAGSSQVYRYEALAAEQQFSGIVCSREKAALEKISALLTKVMLLGGSHTGGYGRVTLTVNDINEWQGEVSSQADGTDRVVVTLLSPVIIRDPDGQHGSSLARLLSPDPHNPATPIHVFSSLSLVGGFNRYWGLPLPQSWALDAGSVFCFHRGEIDMDQLTTLVLCGIGERRNEGYGRIVADWHTSDEYRQSDIDQPDPERITLQGSAGARIAQRMVNQRLRTELEKYLRFVLKPAKISFRNLPSTTQLAQVRVAARRAKAENDLQVIANHLKKLKGAKAAWQQARFGNNPLYKWIIQQVEKTKKQFTEDFLSFSDHLPIFVDIQAEITPELQTEFTARLIDGLMKVAIEEVRANKEGRSHG